MAVRLVTKNEAFSSPFSILELTNEAIEQKSLALTTSPSSDLFFAYTVYEFYRARVSQVTSNGTVTVYMKA
jgi:hypothetical protein